MTPSKVAEMEHKPTSMKHNQRRSGLIRLDDGCVGELGVVILSFKQLSVVSNQAPSVRQGSHEPKLLASTELTLSVQALPITATEPSMESKRRKD
ncbi:hypothetical protein PGTUg99_030813 [Puccinia graminis f. sp. tritici]|uniref:Uncharacterized protein n=1 Tax=Puccinia graminis f. sp. tritici TaxID=56615 RepID=A0A5B0RMP0_PUCGR|nr:hypothetical protein PGTUg99_030813 [Puccinia graminis f. sp. tritici]